MIFPRIFAIIIVENAGEFIMIKVYALNKNNKIELSLDELNKLIEEAELEGYEKGYRAGSKEN